MMKAVILAAGEGTRMRPLTYTRPKPLLPVANRPFLAYLLDNLKAAGIREAMLVVGYRHQQIRDTYGTSYAGISLEYAFQPKPGGTGEALAYAKNFVDGDFLCLNGDVLYDSASIKAAMKSGPNTVLSKEVEHPEHYGVLKVAGDKVMEILEKPANPPSKLVNAGLYVFEPTIFKQLDLLRPSPRGEKEITDALQTLASRSLLRHVVAKETFDFGFPWHVLELNEFLLSKLPKTKTPKGLTGPVSIGRGTTLKPGVMIEGPVMIGNDCVIGPNCFIHHNTTIGDRCDIGQGVELKNSVVLPGTKIKHLSYIGDSIIGENVNIAAGTITANLRHDRRTIIMNGVDSGRKKLGTVIGDNVQVGINTSIYPGKTIGPGSWTTVAAVVDSDVAPGHFFLRDGTCRRLQ